MSTRSIIAEPAGDGFTGIYCHWDGYPTCRGAQLWEALAELGGDVDALKAWALRPGEVGYWSSFGTPSDVAAMGLLPDTQICDLCDGTGDRRAKDLTFPRGPYGPGCNGCNSTGTAPNRDKRSHWAKDSERNEVTSWGDDTGTEWAYVIDHTALTVFERRWGDVADDGGHMVGMFGIGAGEGGGFWAYVGSYKWTDAEPNWEAVENTASVA